MELKGEGKDSEGEPVQEQNDVILGLKIRIAVEVEL